MTKKGFYWHVHHDILLEWCYDYGERVKFIKNYKPKNEIKTRLKLLKPVKGKLPQELVEAGQKYEEAQQKYNEAGQKYNEARQKYNEARQKCDEAWLKYKEAGQKYNEAWLEYYEARQKYNEALAKNKKKIEALHKKECGCREWNGKRIVFRGGRSLNDRKS